jgi:hypothetical protein
MLSIRFHDFDTREPDVNGIRTDASSGYAVGFCAEHRCLLSLHGMESMSQAEVDGLLELEAVTTAAAYWSPSARPDTRTRYERRKRKFMCFAIDNSGREPYIAVRG